jgi:hypothetical protein
MTESRDVELRERIQRLEASNRRWLLAYATTLVIATGLLILAISVAVSNFRAQVQHAEQPSPPAQIAPEGKGSPPTYTNFCRVTCTPEEVVMDFDFDPDLFFRPAAGPGKDSQRITMSHFSAKRISTALQQALKRHEEAFGVIESDVKARAKASGKQP